MNLHKNLNEKSSSSSILSWKFLDKHREKIKFYFLGDENDC